ncbi:unnamed protein product [Rhizoctonia solani]|uniref:Deacetylase sirtuin-type domain-containing protein n=1 Tax=Rhizoctonia solani TaxID=456999 RepID=A0A8H3CRK6_9AGAM|nr:unnamed protein product [Rhizoctonia solani]
MSFAQQQSIPVLRAAQASHHASCQRVHSILASASATTVVCGAGISTSAGIPDFRSEDGLYSLGIKDLGRRKPSELFDIQILQDPDTLRAFGRAMLHDKGRLLRCFTQNIDGLQTRERTDMSEVVVELHGSNVHLMCHKCHRRPEQDIEELEEQIMRDGIIECSRCNERRQLQPSNSDRKLRLLRPGYLLPRVLYNQDSIELEQGGLNLDQLERAAGCADLLLVIGTSLSIDGPIKLVQSLARMVHQVGGAVVYIGKGSLTPSKWCTYFDLHIETDIDTWIYEASRYLAVDKTSAGIGKQVM